VDPVKDLMRRLLMRGQSWSVTRVVVLLLLGALVVTVVTVVRADAAICHNDYPEYPGCTDAQVHQLEAGTARIAGHNYQKARWGQRQPVHIPHAANLKLRHAYNVAVGRFTAARQARPMYDTWHEFVLAAPCLGFGNGGNPQHWCGGGSTGPQWQAIGGTSQTVLDRVAYLSCAGDTFMVAAAAAATGGVGYALIGEAVAPEALVVVTVGGQVTCQAYHLRSWLMNR